MYTMSEYQEIKEPILVNNTTKFSIFLKRVVFGNIIILFKIVSVTLQD